MKRVSFIAALALAAGLLSAVSCSKEDPELDGGQVLSADDAGILVANLVLTDDNDNITGYVTGFGLNEADPGEVTIRCETYEKAQEVFRSWFSLDAVVTEGSDGSISWQLTDEYKNSQGTAILKPGGEKGAVAHVELPAGFPVISKVLFLPSSSMPENAELDFADVLDNLYFGNIINVLSPDFPSKDLTHGSGATLDIRKEAAKPVLVTPTTDSYNPLLSSGKTVPAVGWWAFDVNLAALRDHDFFQQTLHSSAIDINLCTYAKENVLLNSVLQGSINGHMQGKMNLDLIAPTSTSGWAKIVSPLLSTGSQIALNTYVIKEGFIKSTGNQNNNQVYHNEQPIIPPVGGEGGGGALPAVARPQSVAVGAIVSVAIGAVMSLAAKYIDSFAKQKVVDQDFGALTANMSLDLNAVMTTAGTIGGPTTNKVPPASMTMDYIKKTNQDGTPTCLGDGIWNLNNHPVIYVVKDAYWSENNFNSFGARKEFPLGDTDVYSYDLAATKGSRPEDKLKGAFHSSDLWFVFKSLQHCWRPWTRGDWDLSEKMITAWTNFAKYSDPNGPDGGEWTLAPGRIPPSWSSNWTHPMRRPPEWASPSVMNKTILL